MAVSEYSRGDGGGFGGFGGEVIVVSILDLILNMNAGLWTASVRDVICNCDNHNTVIERNIAMYNLSHPSIQSIIPS